MAAIVYWAIAFVLTLVNQPTQAKFFTALDIDNHPCKAENLKMTNRYICDSQGNVICQTGWQEPEQRTSLNDENPCLEPVCSHGCGHGECKAPESCACEVGWEGQHCDICVPLPGCEHGTCKEAFECHCEQGWTGAYCNIPVCKDCVNGFCASPNECICNDGWLGDKCDQCSTLSGCVHGSCVSSPNTCECKEGWSGHFCDVPACNPPCLNGDCMASNNGTQNFCMCKAGWRGLACEQCSPYWKCPNQGLNACTQPNECLCFKNEEDSHGLCNNKILIQPGMNSFSGVTLPNPIFVPTTPVA